MTENNNLVATKTRPHPAAGQGVGKWIMIGGGIGFVIALAWWLLFFHQMLGDDVKAASECFYRTTVQCEIGNFVGSFFDTPPYEPALLWASAGTFVVGLLISVFTSRR
ncbi:MAG: hypothetical protein HOB37_15260 [Rhodospirillaceae bacterium]|jgi:hypothetical protein|nr:hypothetical protein [Rhodospirillaceae bacterium]MBT5298248.1 hypothetical protein [Rhodospirillaceae bacterium]MBT5512999.1 hypothetical protein [Rhodospirillaceae bacterium]MBT6086068.1 hypothetical protein [Rhodospirillaceae bacterium]MBT6609793.1 hypothetical protein [Rhodospirillaceae bacterium]